MHTWFALWFLFASISLIVLSGCQPPPTPIKSSTSSACGVDVKISAAEEELYQLLNRYRRAHGLPMVRLSTSLVQVAKSHVLDLQAHEPQGKCNLHSWSGHGAWSACCYAFDHSLAQCMWSKPHELTPYRGNGYEIAASYLGPRGEGITPRIAMRLLQKSRDHNAVMLNQGPWTAHLWESVGVGVYGLYAAVWFGNERDPCGYF